MDNSSGQSCFASTEQFMRQVVSDWRVERSSPMLTRRETASRSEQNQSGQASSCVPARGIRDQDKFKSCMAESIKSGANGIQYNWWASGSARSCIANALNEVEACAIASCLGSR
jgi:hypothetical protein